MAPVLGPADHRQLTVQGATRPLRRLARAVPVGAPLLLGLVHVAVVAQWYHVGSFDDDAGYILAGQALAAGHGLTAQLANGTTVAGSAPPGYSILLAPLLAVFGDNWIPLRILTVLCYAATFPLLWAWTGRRGLGDRLRVAVLVLVALNPVATTFGSMVMAEMPLLVVLLALLLALDRWGPDRRAGVAVVACAVALVWLKEAAIGMDAGLVLWLWWRRQWVKGVVVGGAVGVSLLPVVIARLAAGIPLAGSRYSQELGAYYSGGLSGRVLQVFPAALHQFFAVALPASVVPRGAPLWYFGFGGEVLKVLSWQVSILTVAGFVVWVRRTRDVTVVMVPVYLVESLLWPYVNERRVILVLPVVLAWYVVGLAALIGALVRRAAALRVPCAVAVTAVVVAPLVAQFPRDYLYAVAQSSSQPQGSRYMALLAAAPGPAGVVETDYLSTTALFARHRSAHSAFLANNPLAAELTCVPPAEDLADMTADGAGWLLTGNLNKPDMTDNPCILAAATTQPWAVRLLRTSTDGASVFELIGPGSVHPDLVDLTAAATVTGDAGPAGMGPLAPQSPSDNPGSAPTTTALDGAGTLTWTFPAPAPVTQVSVGAAYVVVSGRSGPTGRVALQLDEAGRWVTVASSPEGVGGGYRAPFLLGRPPAGTVAAAARVVIGGSGTVTALDFHVLGPGAIGAGRRGVAR